MDFSDDPKLYFTKLYWEKNINGVHEYSHNDTDYINACIDEYIDLESVEFTFLNAD